MFGSVYPLKNISVYAGPPDSWCATSVYAQGAAHILAKFNTEVIVTTLNEESSGQADMFYAPPLAASYLSQRYTPESTHYADSFGVAYITIIMSHVRRVNLTTNEKRVTTL